MVRLQLTPWLVCGILALTAVSSGQSPERPETPQADARPHGGVTRSEGTHGAGPHGEGPRRTDGKRSFEQREHEPFFEALREVHVETSNKELFEMVRHESIRQEIHLSSADAQQIQANMRLAFKAIFAVREKNREETLSKEELKQQIREAVSPLEAESIAILRKPEVDFKRMLGLYVQARNYRALMNDQVAEEIGLQGQELDDFRQTRAASWRSIMDDIRRSIEKEIRNTPPGSSPRESISQLLRQAEGKLDVQLSSQLSEQQRAQLQQLKGAPFPLPERLFSMPPNRGRGGPEGRGPIRGEAGRGESSRGESSRGEASR